MYTRTPNFGQGPPRLGISNSSLKLIIQTLTAGSILNNKLNCYFGYSWKQSILKEVIGILNVLSPSGVAAYLSSQICHVLSIIFDCSTGIASTRDKPALSDSEGSIT